MQVIKNRYGTFRKPSHGRVTLSDAMRMLGLHPTDHKREAVKKRLTKLAPHPLLSAYLVYSWDEVANIVREQKILQQEVA